jgi:glutamate-5-semialdehyde dehydrogenase
VIVPRGGKGLIERIAREAKVPVIKHLDGVCHVYVDAAADVAMAIAIADNAKTQRYSPCNTMETLLVHAGIARACSSARRRSTRQGRRAARLRALARARRRDEARDRGRLAHRVPGADPRVRVVDSLDEAIDHIATYGSQHTDAIVTNDHAPRCASCARSTRAR